MATVAAASLGLETLDAGAAQATPFTGMVTGQRVAVFARLPLDSGAVLAPAAVAYKTWGTLNAARDNVMVVCHALSGTCDVADWWGPLLGRGKAFDPAVFFIVCANVLGSPYGTSSPVSINPATQRPYGADFPNVTIRDTVRLHRMLLDALNVARVQVVIGGSLGGMQVLEWAFFGIDYVRCIVPIATSAKHSAWCISWSEAQRQAIQSDPMWLDGRYTADAPPNRGLATARITAMLTYRSRNSFESRFGRKLQSSSPVPTRDTTEASGERGRYNPNQDVFTAQSYLRYQGDKFVKRFDANCYMRITEMLDSHDISLGRGDFHSVLRSIRQPTCIIGIDSDGLFTVQEQDEMREHIPNSELLIITSPDGHDGFLLEFRQVNEAVLAWLHKALPDVYASVPADAAAGADDLADDEALKNRTTAVGEAWGDDDAAEAVAAATASSDADVVTGNSVDLLKW